MWQGWEESQVTNSEQEWDEEKQCYTYRVDVKKLKWKEAFQQVSAELLQLESEAAAKGPRNLYGLPPPRSGAGGAEKDEEQELEAHNARCLAHAQKALPGVTQQLCNLLAAAQTLEQAPEDAFDSGLCGTLRGLLQRHQGYKTQLEEAPLRQEQELEEGPDAALLKGDAQACQAALRDFRVALKTLRASQKKAAQEQKAARQALPKSKAKARARSLPENQETGEEHATAPVKRRRQKGAA